MLSLLTLSLAASTAPDILLSRTEAEAMSAAELGNLLLAEFPHEEIIGVELPDPGPGPHGEIANPTLSFIALQERGQAGRGRLCRARRIIVTFVWPDGGMGKPFNVGNRDDVMRRSQVSARPQVAVLDDQATDALCASLPGERYADLSPAPIHEQRLRQFLELAEALKRGRKLGLNVTCGDWRGANERPCEVADAIAKIDWSRLVSVQETQWPHGVSATRITFVQSEGPLIHAYLSGTDTIDAAKLTYEWPAPF